MKHDQSLEVNGTFLVGHFRATYEELEKALGTPDLLGDYKVSTEWKVSYKDQVFTIYDYKMTSLYDESLPSPESIRSCPIPIIWNIGSHKDSMVSSFIFELNRIVFIQTAGLENESNNT